MPEIKLEAERKFALVEKVRGYLSKEFDLEVGGFEAEFFIDFLAKEMGTGFYNQGLHDAQVIVSSKLEDISDAIYEIEKPVD
ncbi:DUF2164 domain-containing protein [Microbulbifer sp. OS29]|uniref:DUF2164 domain-containing protein n=1 Tax=Microbulbifer okhotskensis TaxID=2926617 RepID=A0A9X2EM49_9GAMM|nr:DUF2164 domain-containing protein [Microbulbifer okhotskensis]MCO1334777.1 DUF2164 domain-containing protein [Microbulbifer okhotskensis]